MQRICVWGRSWVTQEQKQDQAELQRCPKMTQEQDQAELARCSMTIQEQNQDQAQLPQPVPQKQNWYWQAWLKPQEQKRLAAGKTCGIRSYGDLPIPWTHCMEDQCRGPGGFPGLALDGQAEGC